jgi:hypothetical protein
MLCIDEPTFLSRVQFSPVGVGGKKLADEALRKQPDLKVLYTTGYTANAVVHGGVLDAGVNLLGKPFTLEQLAAKLRLVLDQ